MSIKNPFESYIYNTFLRPEYDAFNEGVKACDKWWVDNMRLMFARCCESTCQYMTPVCSYLSNACMAWQSLKQPISPSGEGK